MRHGLAIDDGVNNRVTTSSKDKNHGNPSEGGVIPNELNNTQ